MGKTLAATASRSEMHCSNIVSFSFAFTLNKNDLHRGSHCWWAVETNRYLGVCDFRILKRMKNFQCEYQKAATGSKGMEVSMTKSKHLIFITSLIVTICSSGSAYAYDGYMRADIYCSEYSSIVKNDEQRLEGYLWYLTGFLVGLNFQRKPSWAPG